MDVSFCSDIIGICLCGFPIVAGRDEYVRDKTEKWFHLRCNPVKGTCPTCNHSVLTRDASNKHNRVYYHKTCPSGELRGLCGHCQSPVTSHDTRDKRGSVYYHSACLHEIRRKEFALLE